MAQEYNIYFGTIGNMVLISSDQSGLSIEVPSNLAYSTEYEWRVDVTEDEELSTGTVWSFTTLAFDPPIPSSKNNMVTLRRLIAACDNKVYYEA